MGGPQGSALYRIMLSAYFTLTYFGTGYTVYMYLCIRGYLPSPRYFHGLVLAAFNFSLRDLCRPNAQGESG